ncbi:MAG TPA: prepilin-type N-terminal cleavage/methylation domain-containing protein [Gemmatimonadales bacterium]|nr:prepilin-type N-terminal cleavage/methylation domain-containing protein [Gemmatimonadales bacterium]
MKVQQRSGFTLIELLIVVVIIGILATIAIPKFASTKDKAKMASVRSDLRNLMTAEEAYFADNSTYATLAAVQAVSNFTLSSGNSGTVIPGVSGFTATVSNSAISTGLTQCSVTWGGGAPAGVDGVIVCS